MPDWPAPCAWRGRKQAIFDGIADARAVVRRIITPCPLLVGEAEAFVRRTLGGETMGSLTHPMVRPHLFIESEGGEGPRPVDDPQLTNNRMSDWLAGRWA
jgi:hypothetical protein